MDGELCETEQRRSCKRCKGLKQLHPLSVLHQCRKKTPFFHSQSTPPPFPTNPSLPSLSSSSFPSNKHTGSVHYYSAGFTWTRIIALLLTTVSGEAGGGREHGEGEGREMQETSLIEKNKSPLCFLCSNIYYQTAACMSCFLFCLCQKNLQGNKARSVVNTGICFPLWGFEFITCLSLNLLRSYTQIIICTDRLTKDFIHENKQKASIGQNSHIMVTSISGKPYFTV